MCLCCSTCAYQSPASGGAVVLRGQDARAGRPFAGNEEASVGTETRNLSDLVLEPCSADVASLGPEA